MRKFLNKIWTQILFLLGAVFMLLLPFFLPFILLYTVFSKKHIDSEKLALIKQGLMILGVYAFFTIFSLLSERINFNTPKIFYLLEDWLNEHWYFLIIGMILLALFDYLRDRKDYLIKILANSLGIGWCGTPRIQMRDKTMMSLQDTDETRIAFAKNLVRHLEKIGQIPGKATDEEIEAEYWKNKTTTLPQDNNKTRYQAAVNLVKHLYKIGQIKEMPTEEEMLAHWETIPER